MPFDETQAAALAGPAGANPPPWPATRRQIRTLGAALVILAVLAAYLFLIVLNAGLADRTWEPARTICLARETLCFHVTFDGQLLMLVMLAGALGSCIHAATSFGDFVGNRQLAANWLWWYLLKPVTGTILATIVYLCVQGAFLAGAGDAEHVNVYGILALAGLVGACSKQATDKLGATFDTVFGIEADARARKRRESLADLPPEVTPEAPSLAIASATYTPARAMAADPEHGDDGCGVPVTHVTADEDLPAARGGVAS